MPDPVAYLNGQFLPLSQLTLSPFDVGFVQGVTVAEQLRTFSGRLFELEKHLARLQRSLDIIGVDPGLSLAEIGVNACELVYVNHRHLDPADDLGLTIFVTPGHYANYLSPGMSTGPTIGMHTQPLSFHLWHHKYQQGESLVPTEFRQVPGDCWPTELKCRSRMHYYLADRRAQGIEPGARALMLDHEDYITEASTANLLIYDRKHGIVSPPKSKILPGVSMSVLEQLAVDLGLPVTQRDLRVADILAADEVLLCSTSPCVWPVTRLAGQVVGDGVPGPICRKLLQAWSDRVGFDIQDQARRFAAREVATAGGN
jgi:branched-chain amino acid aminotransferase